MDSRTILISLAIKFSGNWDAIFQALEKKEQPDEAEAKRLLKKVKSKCITCLDEEYPESLKRVFRPPFVLFYEGDISLLSDKNNKIAVIGSRKYSEYGEEVTRKLVKAISKDFVVISGLALGIDSIAQSSAIESGGRTIGVLGNGLNTYYLKENEELFDECKKNHLVITEYPDDVPPSPFNFPVRNRIIAGLCENLLITEGKTNSGTSITAMLMLQKNGNICCVPTRVGEQSICNHLISLGAYLVETAEDIYHIAKVPIKKPVFEK